MSVRIAVMIALFVLPYSHALGHAALGLGANRRGGAVETPVGRTGDDPPAEAAQCAPHLSDIGSHVKIESSYRRLPRSQGPSGINRGLAQGNGLSEGKKRQPKHP